MTDYQDIKFQKEDGIGFLTLNRPEKRNALSRNLMAEMTDLLKGIGADSGVRAVILRAEGTVFSSGHDLSEMLEGDAVFYRRIFDACTEMMESIRGLPQPVIAQVQGMATAAGCQLVATCDLAVASQEARFATPGVRIGLFCHTPQVPLSRALIIFAATLATAACVAISGPIGWVGLVIPHFARMLAGSDYRVLLPASLLMGASFLILVDDFSRLLTTSEIPIGIVTSFVGVPVFLILIRRGSSR